MALPFRLPRCEFHGELQLFDCRAARSIRYVLYGLRHTAAARLFQDFSDPADGVLL
jgi:hypothetical protein